MTGTPDAMVAASQPLAVDAGLDILRDGGNAVDAAIATNAVLALVEPTGCGLGGDLFAQIWCAGDSRLVGYDGAGRSPQALDADTLRLAGDEIPATGPLPVSVPGCVEAWGRIHEAHGRLPWARLFEAAIEHAGLGFPVTPVIADQWKRGGQRLAGEPGFADTFLPGGRAPRTGEVFRNPMLATTLDRIARDGWSEFYSGRTADELDRFCRATGCHLRREDLEAHVGSWVEPVHVDYGAVRVHQLAPPGQGLCVLQILRLLDVLGHRDLDVTDPMRLHLAVEAKKLVYADRARYYGDPAFSRIPVEELVSEQYARERASRIDRTRAMRGAEAGDPVLKTSDTVYLATADADGNMVSWIQSNYMGFGSGLCAPGLGFGLQNRGRLFHLADPDHPNAYAPGKKPFHTIIPGFTTRDGRPDMAFGVMGGDYQPVGQCHVLQLIEDHGFGLQEAGEAPRVHHAGSPSPTGAPADADGGTVLVEATVPRSTCRALEEQGHEVRVAEPLLFGGYQAIRRTERGYEGGSEPRKDGRASGIRLG